jgi:hypothetical protein
MAAKPSLLTGCIIIYSLSLALMDSQVVFVFDNTATNLFIHESLCKCELILQDILLEVELLGQRTCAFRNCDLHWLTVYTTAQIVSHGRN